MSMTHTLSRALGAAALAVALATSGAAVAAADPAQGTTTDAPGYRRTGPADDLPPTIAPRRWITSEVVWRDGRLYLRGDVEDYFGRQVTVQRQRCDTCRWRQHDVVHTGRKGWFRSVIRAPRRGSTFWRATVAPSDGYTRSYSATWETYY